MTQSRFRSFATNDPAKSPLQVHRQYPNLKRSPLLTWLGASAKKLRARQGGTAFVVLSGGADLVGFRLRAAQSQMRADLLPSCFDQAMMLVATPGRGNGADTYVTYSIPLRTLDLNTTPVRNAIVKQKGLPNFLGDWEQTPNVAVMRFPAAASEVVEAAEQLAQSRLSEDLVTLTCVWLSYLCGAKDAVNPLLSLTSVPSAAFLEACFGRARQDVSPGVISRVVSPESIWQARFWADQYGSEDEMAAQYVINQPAASVSWPRAEDTYRDVHG